MRAIFVSFSLPPSLPPSPSLSLSPSVLVSDALHRAEQSGGTRVNPTHTAGTPVVYGLGAMV
jgi:hypothetical protein